MSSRIAVKMGPAVAPPRLSKAKSSPNVSRPPTTTTTARSSPKTEEQPPKRPVVQGILKNGNSAKARNAGLAVQATPRQRVGDAAKSRVSGSSSSSAGGSARTPEAAARRKPVAKDSGSPSCTILEDRVLLKKGLGAGSPAKLPKKPEELRRKSLSRSTSLWSVSQTPPSSKSALVKTVSSEPRQQPSKQSSRCAKATPTLNRATSLWNVGGRLPSRIPLSTQHLQGLGQSLGDLSLVDRPAEKAAPKKLVDFDEVDRSVEEHIYENCREKVPAESSPIYENLAANFAGKEEKPKAEEKPKLEVSLTLMTTSELEKRAEQLLSELDEEDAIPIPAPKPPVAAKRPVQPAKRRSVEVVPCQLSLDGGKQLLAHGREDIALTHEDLALSKENLARSQQTLEKSRVMAKSQDSLQLLQSAAAKQEMSIQEIRRNWERQIEKCQVPSAVEEAKAAARKRAGITEAGKRKKDIEHLVNFFNCKNTEPTPAVKQAAIIQDSWAKGPKDEEESKPKSCGYASDGNSSEDSGHISNENEPDDEKQPVAYKPGGEVFLEEIIQELDNSLERTIGVFEATPIVRRFAQPIDEVKNPTAEQSKPPVKISVSSSSGASSIESWEDGKQIRKSANAIEPPTQWQDESQIFFRAGALERLESQRDEKLTGHIILLQARCRGYLARRKLNTLKLQDLAVRCIQRNVRKLMSVREWPWWRLYVKVAPLLNVHRTEDQLKARTEELEVLRAKVDRLEQERNHLKHDNDRLEAKIRKKMPLSPTTYCQPLTSSTSSLPPTDNASLYSDDPISISSVSSSYSSRRPPLPPGSHFQPRALSKIAVIRPNSTTLISRSPSPSLSSRLSLQLRSPSSCSFRSITGSPQPRRVYPQAANRDDELDLEELSGKEQAPVVFDASLNFVLGVDRQPVRQSFRPTASHLEPQTASSYLSNKISSFLQRTDHIMDEWKRIGRGSDDTTCASPDGRRRSVYRSRSATNIMIKGYQYFSRASSVAKSPSRPVSRLSEDDERTVSPCDELSEMTADYAEEHSTSTLAAERIDAEQSERLRLERELQDVSEANKSLQQQAERLEMELLYARAADLNGMASDQEDAEDGAVYKQRYQHAMRELEFTKRKMAQQHEDDLEQLVGLKKQLEKKLADAYEEVEEQRQVVGQWKRRVQKLNGEMHDLRLLLEEQTARNNLLEKKQRKFDSETQNLMDDLRQEKAQRERLAREKEIAIAEKFAVEQSLSDAKLEIELKEERLHTLTQELEELTFGGKTEEEVAQLKKAKHELEKKAKDQEEELDDLAGQVQLLEQAKLRLEMSIEQQRKEMRKEMQQRDEELEDVRGSAMKKVKALEAQLENEHEERTIVLREKHDLERRLVALEDQDRTDRAAEAETIQRLKRDLKRTRALLRNAQTMLERSKGDSTGKAALRHLKNQLEDAECARAVAVKAKQALEQDLNETQAALEEAQRQRSEAEERANASNRERTELLSQLEENEEEMAEVLKKYRTTVQQVSAEQAQLQEAQVQIAALEAEKSSLKDQLSELTHRLESVEQLGDPTANSLATRRLELRTKELESKLELELTTRARLETQIARLKENVEKLQAETGLLRAKEQIAQDTARRLQRSLREARDEAASTSAREQEAIRARQDLEKALEAAETETKTVKEDLKLASQMIDELQSAIQGDLDFDCSEEGTSENSDSD